MLEAALEQLLWKRDICALSPSIHLLHHWVITEILRYFNQPNNITELKKSVVLKLKH